MPKNRVLITGSAGFIGFHLSKYFLDNKFSVIGIDNLNNYYSTKLKISRNNILKKYRNYKFFKSDITDKNKIFRIFKDNKIDFVINLAAQAGVQYSLKNPFVYVKTNILGFLNIIEAAKKYNVKKKKKYFMQVVQASTDLIKNFHLKKIKKLITL